MKPFTKGERVCFVEDAEVIYDSVNHFCGQWEVIPKDFYKESLIVYADQKDGVFRSTIVGFYSKDFDGVYWLPAQIFKRYNPRRQRPKRKFVRKDT